MRLILFTLVIFLCVEAQAKQVIFEMDEATYQRLAHSTFGWLHTDSDQSPVYGKSEEEKLHYSINYSLPFATFGRIKSLESEGITMRVTD